MKDLVQAEVKRLVSLGADELVKAPRAVELVRKGMKNLTRDEMKKVKEIVV